MRYNIAVEFDKTVESKEDLADDEILTLVEVALRKRIKRIEIEVIQNEL